MTQSAACDREIIGGLSSVSKMPGAAFGLSAEACITGAKLRRIPGSVCANCYALKNLYRMANVRRAHARRMHRLRRALNSPEARERYIGACARLIGRLREPYFRWFDSGDLQSVEHLELIAEVCRRTPAVNHWMPTKEYGFVRRYLAHSEAPANLTIRVSAPMVGQVLSAVSPGCVSSAVGADAGYRCPAPLQSNECRDCRACWNRGVPLVSYREH